MKKTGRIILRILILIILFLFSFAAVYPLIFLLGGSLKSTPELGNNLAALWFSRWNSALDLAAL